MPWNILSSKLCRRRSHKTNSTSTWCPGAITTSGRKSRLAPLITFIDGRRWCTSQVYYPRAIFRCPMRKYKWNGFYDLPQVWLHRVGAIWVQATGQDASDSHGVLPIDSQDSWEQWKLAAPSAQKDLSGSKTKLGRELEEQYALKIHHISNQRKSHRSYAQRNDGNYCCHHHGQCKQHKLCNDGGHDDNKRMTRRVPTSTRTRTSSPVASMESTPTTCMKSAMPICATKRITNCTQTTTSTSTDRTATTTIIATPVATMSCAGASILPCPKIATLVQAARAKPRRIFTYLSRGHTWSNCDYFIYSNNILYLSMVFIYLHVVYNRYNNLFQ